MVGESESNRAPRAFISYAHVRDGGEHAGSVLNFWKFLRTCGIDAQLDESAAAQRQEWPLWMGDQVRAADFILVIASRAYRERAEGRSDPDEGRGVQWEARLIREAFYRDQRRLNRFIPVILPGEDIDGVPDFLAPTSSSVYYVSDFTVAGARPLLHLLTGQPAVLEPPLGPVPDLSAQPGPNLRVPQAVHRDQPRPTAPNVRNVITGNVSGTVIQAGTVVGPVTLGGPTPTPHTVRPPTYTVGGGLPGWQQRFERAYAVLRDFADVREPLGDVRRYGPGVRQEFAGWVLCALDDGRTTAVPDTIWDAMHNAGSAALSANPLDTIGFPVFADGGQRPMIVDANAGTVDLAGGTWGPGTVRWSRDGWEWQPKPGQVSQQATAVAERWTGDAVQPLLRIRVIARQHVARSTPWQITPGRRQRFADALPNSELADVLRALHKRRRNTVLAKTWTPGPYPNNAERASYFWSLAAPNRVRAIEAVTVAAAEPDGGEIVTCTDLRLHAAWAATIDASGGSKRSPSALKLPEVRDFLVAAWELTTTGLLDLFGFPVGGRRWREVPTVELRLTVEETHGQSVRWLDQLIDIKSAFGAGSSRPTELAVTIPVVPNLSLDLRRTLTRQALAYLGRSHGYRDASADRV